MQLLSVLFAMALALVSQVAATCPGFNYGIIDTHKQLFGANKWVVVDDSCNVVTSLIANNPCTQGMFDCSPAPITFTGLHYNGQNYACRGDSRAGSCPGWGDVQVCCRNDGH